MDVDHRPNDEVRIVQLTPPGSACSITIGKGLGSLAAMTPGSLEGLQISVGDIEAAHAVLVERGVDVTPIRHLGEAGWAEGKGDDDNSFLFFSDPDGNGWAVHEGPLLRAELQATAED